MTEKLLTYALGRGLDYHDMPAVRAIVRDAARNDYRFSSLVLGIVDERAVSDADETDRVDRVECDRRAIPLGPRWAR